MQKQFVITETQGNYQKVYKVITPVAEMLFLGCAFAFDMFVLDLDGEKSPVHCLGDIREAIGHNLDVVIEVGWVPFPQSVS